MDFTKKLRNNLFGYYDFYITVIRHVYAVLWVLYSIQVYFKDESRDEFFQFPNFWPIPSAAGYYMFKVNNRNTRKRCQVCSYFTPCSSVSIVSFEHVIFGWVIWAIHAEPKQNIWESNSSRIQFHR